MKNITLIILTIILIGKGAYVIAQQNLFTIDLAHNVNETVKFDVQNKDSFEVLIINKIPLKEYDVSITVKKNLIKPLSLPSTSTIISPEKGMMAPCEVFTQFVNSIFTIEEEENIPSKIDSISALIKATELELSVKDTTEEGCRWYHIYKAQSIISSTRRSLGKFKLNSGEELEIIIKRKNGKPAKTWTRIYSTPPKGTWRVSYGFSFIPELFYKEEIYFSSSNDGATSYTITKENNRKIMSYAPSIFFTWIPTKALDKNLSWGVAGGLGFDFENPTVFLGTSFTYNQNISLNIGIVALKQNVLLGKYKDEQIINENLSREQLHEELFRINPFVSLSFRFDQNPFNRNANK